MMDKLQYKALFGSFVVVILLAITTCAVAETSDLTPDQKAKLKQFAQEYRQNSTQLRNELRSARAELARQYEPQQINETDAQTAIDALSKVQLSLLALHLRNQLAIRQILTEPQFTAFVGRFSADRPHRPRVHGTDDYPDRKLLETLSLTPDQQKQLKVLTALVNKRKTETKLMNDATKKLMQKYSVYDLNEKQAQRLISLIHKRQCNLTRLSHKMLKLLHRVLNKEQIRQLIPPGPDQRNNRSWNKPGQGKRERSFRD